MATAQTDRAEHKGYELPPYRVEQSEGRFEVRGYGPHIVAEVTVAGDRSFKASVTASDNRVGAIVEAFDQVVAQVLGKLAAWVNARGEGSAASAVVSHHLP